MQYLHKSFLSCSKPFKMFRNEHDRMHGSNSFDELEDEWAFNHWYSLLVLDHAGYFISNMEQILS